MKIKNKRILDKISRLFDLCVKQPSKPISKEEMSMYRSAYGEGTIVLTGEESTLFHEIVNLLLKEPLSEHCSEKFIKDELWGFIFNIVKNREEVRKNKDKVIKNFLEQILINFDDWRVLAVMDDLDSTFEIKIGNVRFFVSDNSELKKWEFFRPKTGKELKKGYSIAKSKIKGFKINFGTFKKGYKSMQKNEILTFKDKVCAEVVVKSNDAEKSIEKGKVEINKSLDVIRAFKGRAEIREPLFLTTENLRTKDGLFHRTAPWVRDRAYPWKTKIEEKEKKKFQNFLKIFEPFLTEPNPTRLDKRILRSLRWCGEAIQEKNEEDRIIKYFTSLEALLVRRGEEIDKTLSNRISSIFGKGKSEESRRLIYDDVMRLYELRSNIVHGSEFEISKKDIHKLNWITRNSLIYVAELVLNKKMKKIGEVIEYINKNCK